MAWQFQFFMAPEDERELLRKFESWDVEIYPEFGDPRGKPLPMKGESAARLGAVPAWYFAVEAPVGYPIKRGQNKGLWKIDEIKSPVMYFSRSQTDEDGELRSGYFWVELETAGDNSAMGGKPDLLRRLFQEIEKFMKVRYRKSKPVGHLIGPHAARLFEAGAVLREAGRKGETVVPYK